MINTPYGPMFFGSIDGHSLEAVHQESPAVDEPNEILGRDLQNRLLKKCVLEADFEMAEKHISLGANVHVVDANGCNLLHEAVERNLVETIKWLFSKKVSQVARNSFGDTPLNLAMKRRHMAAICCIFDLLAMSEVAYFGESQYEVFSIPDHRGRCPFARLFSKEEFTKEERDELLDVLNNPKCPTVHRFMDLGDPHDFSKFIASFDATRSKELVNAKDTQGNTPFHRLAEQFIYGHTHPGCNEKEFNFGVGIPRCLRLTAEYANILLKAGADPEVKNNDGKTPVDLTDAKGLPTFGELIKEIQQEILCPQLTFTNHPPDIALILERGHLHRMVEEMYCRLLKESVLTGDFEMAEKLIESGADVNFIDASGWNLLHEAVDRNLVQSIKWLFSMKVSQVARNSSGDTPFSLAIKKHHMPTIRCILKLMGDVIGDGKVIDAALTLPDNEGGSPFVRLGNLEEFNAEEQKELQAIFPTIDIPFAHRCIGFADPSYLDKVLAATTKGCREKLVNEKDDRGNTALHRLVEHLVCFQRSIQPSSEYASILLKAGADPEIRNIDGATPADVANAAELPQFCQIIREIQLGLSQPSDIAPSSCGFCAGGGIVGDALEGAAIFKPELDGQCERAIGKNRLLVRVVSIEMPGVPQSNTEFFLRLRLGQATRFTQPRPMLYPFIPWYQDLVFVDMSTTEHGLTPSAQVSAHPLVIEAVSRIMGTTNETVVGCGILDLSDLDCSLIEQTVVSLSPNFGIDLFVQTLGFGLPKITNTSQDIPQADEDTDSRFVMYGGTPSEEQLNATDKYRLFVRVISAQLDRIGQCNTEFFVRLRLGQASQFAQPQPMSCPVIPSHECFMFAEVPTTEHGLIRSAQVSIHPLVIEAVSRVKGTTDETVMGCGIIDLSGLGSCIIHHIAMSLYQCVTINFLVQALGFGLPDGAAMPQFIQLIPSQTVMDGVDSWQEVHQPAQTQVENMARRANNADPFTMAADPAHQCKQEEATIDPFDNQSYRNAVAEAEGCQNTENSMDFNSQGGRSLGSALVKMAGASPLDNNFLFRPSKK